MNWCFAKVNGRLVEIFFDDQGAKRKINGHCYVTEAEYKTKQEKRWIEEDTKKFRFSYRNKKYRALRTKAAL